MPDETPDSHRIDLPDGRRVEAMRHPGGGVLLRWTDKEGMASVETVVHLSPEAADATQALIHKVLTENTNG